MIVKRGLRVLDNNINDTIKKNTNNIIKKNTNNIIKNNTNNYIKKNTNNNILSKSRKGSEILIMGHLWELIATAGVIIIMLVAIAGIANNSNYWKKYYAVDLALMGDLANANQGDFSINYALKEQQDNILSRNHIIKSKMFELVIAQDSIESHDAPKERKTRYSVFPYSKSKNIYVSDDSIISDFLVLSKSGDLFAISGHDSIQEGCPSFDNSRDIAVTSFSSMSLNTETAGFPVPTEYAIKPITANSVSNLGAAQSQNTAINAVQTANNIQIKIIYAKGDQLTIFYDGSARGEKLACLIARKYIQSNSQITPALKEYDGSLDGIQAFSDFKQGITGNNNAFWIGILLPKDMAPASAVDINNMASHIVSEAVRDYFK